MKKLIVFDLDGTIAESKSSLDAEMSALLHDLLDIVKVAVISGGNWPQFERQLVSRLPSDANLNDLSLLPTCGTKFYKYNSVWEKLYSEDFSADEIRRGRRYARPQMAIGLARSVVDAAALIAIVRWPARRSSAGQGPRRAVLSAAATGVAEKIAGS